MTDTNGSTSKPLLSNKAYDILKMIAQIILPALGTLYFGLAGYWHFPHPDEVVGTIVVIDTFLGVLLGIGTKAYNNSDAKYDGAINVTEPVPGETKLFTLELNSNVAVDELDTKKEVIFKVNPN